MDPFIGAALVGGTSSGLSGWLQAKAQREMLAQQERLLAEKRARAYGLLNPQDYALGEYQSPLTDLVRSSLAGYLKGGLSPAQLAILKEQRTAGEAGIARTAAGRGMPGGAQSLLAMQLARGLGTQALQLGEERERYGLGAAMPWEQLWERRYMAPRETELRRREMLAQY